MNNSEPLSPICYRIDARRTREVIERKKELLKANISDSFRDEIRESIELYERIYDSLMEIAEALEKRRKS